MDSTHVSRFDFIADNICAPIEPVIFSPEERIFKEFFQDKGEIEAKTFLSYIRELLTSEEIKGFFSDYKELLTLYMRYKASTNKENQRTRLLGVGKLYGGGVLRTGDNVTFQGCTFTNGEGVQIP